MTCKEKYIFSLLILLLISTGSTSQTLDSIFVKEVKKYFPVVDYKKSKDDIINMVILNNERKLKYGKWVYYHDNGNIASTGKIIITMRSLGKCGNEIYSYNRNPYKYLIEKQVGQWDYYYKNGKKRRILKEGEIAFNGYYKIFTKDGRIKEEGYYKQGKLINGKIYTYYSQPNFSTKVATYKNSKFKGVKWI